MKLYKHNKTFRTESGSSIEGLEIAYHTFGNYQAGKSKVVWVCHAFTANSDVFDWWPGLFGEDCYFNSDDWFIICANYLGSCYGTTGPLSTNPLTGSPYYHDFPVITVRDMVQCHMILRKHLQIEQIDICIGGSIGGAQALEWAIMEPDIIKHLIPIATNTRYTPWGIALNESQRMAIEADPTWKENRDDAGMAGLSAARSIALLSYRNYGSYNLRQAELDMDKKDNFKASSYQRYQGTKLINRFNAFSYYTLTLALDSNNVGRERGGVEQALGCIKAKTTTIGITSDILFPIEEQKKMSSLIPNSTFFEINSIFGHDGFLIEVKQIEEVVRTVLH